MLGFVVFVAAYLAALGPFRGYFKSAERVAPTRVLMFLLGAGVLLFALVSPLDAIGDRYLFTAHMLQHTLLMVVAPPLLLLGVPGWMLRPLLTPPPVKRIALPLTRAPVAFLLFNLDMLLWHLPLFYEATLENEAIHILEHLSFIALGVLNWWPVLGPVPELPRLPYPGQMLYLVLNMVPAMALGWFFVSASSVVYPTYAAAPRVFALYGVDDQLIGGYMMAMPGGAINLGALLIILDKWVHRPGRAVP